MQTDVIVAGGGIAGAAVTAALSEFGYRILIVEPGLDHSRRLAGELIHPPGVSNLKDLGLRDCLEQAGGMPVKGFAVVTGSGTHLLPYSEVPGLQNDGVSLEHGTMANRLPESCTR